MAKAITKAIRMATRQIPSISNGPNDFPLEISCVVVSGTRVVGFPVDTGEATKNNVLQL